MTEDVPGYRVLEQVGEGGFSVVYRAHQERLDRAVALKVLSISAVDDSAMRRFQRECKITGRLSGHPNIVTVLDTGTTRSGRPYIAMEYFERGALIDRLEREGPLPVPEVLRVGVKMASALAATHETDVLHRDVKPQNILVSRYGEPALADFGIARLTDSFDHSHTQAFTPHHAAPEVLEGRTPGVGADVYSLGSTLYQLLAGRPAFKGPQGEGIAQLVFRIMNDPPPVFQRADVPQQAFEVISRAMAKTPEQRYATAVEFAQRLRRLQAELGLPMTDLTHSGDGGGGFENVVAPQVPSHPRPPAVPEWAPTTPRPDTTPAAHLAPEGPSAFDVSANAPTQLGAAAARAGAARAADAEIADARTVAGRAPGAVAPGPAGLAGPADLAGAGPADGIAGAGLAGGVAGAGLAGGLVGPGAPAQSPSPVDGVVPAWPPQAVVTGPPHTTQPQPPGQEFDGGDGPRRGLIVAASIALVGGLVVGISALALTGGDKGGGTDPTAPASSGPPAQGGGTQLPQGNAPLTKSQLLSARPYGLKAREIGRSVILTWRLPPNARRLPILAQQAPFARNAVVPLQNGAVTATFSKLNPKLGYCFQVGSVPGLGADNSPQVSWSKPICIRNARVTS
ncbi:protein kinase [Spirillospora sp. NPDC047279]|uniref:serine/threonine-protein kinase n=1 Tax=Spirillospora sp. NPDC047279 TaxID=3155478 RepID=UPI0033C111A1